MRVLVHRRNGGLGDVVCMLPAVDALAARYPQAEVDMALPAEYAGLIRTRFGAAGNRRRRVRVIGCGYRKFRPRWRRILEARYDLTFDLSGPDGAPGRVEQNRIDYFADVCGVSAAGAGGSAPVLSYRVPDADREWCRVWLEAHRLAPGQHPLVCLHLKSARAEKDWPLRCFRELARHLIERGVGVISLEKSLRLGVPGAADAVGLSLRHVAALVAASNVLAGPDSGPMHLAAAVGTPCLALFGPTDPGIVLKHYRATHRWVRHPEGIHPEGMGAITVERVLAGTEALLRPERRPAAAAELERDYENYSKAAVDYSDKFRSADALLRALDRLARGAARSASGGPKAGRVERLVVDDERTARAAA